MILIIIRAVVIHQLLIHYLLSDLSSDISLLIIPTELLSSYQSSRLVKRLNPSLSYKDCPMLTILNRPRCIGY